MFLIFHKLAACQKIQYFAKKKTFKSVLKNQMYCQKYYFYDNCQYNISRKISNFKSISLVVLQKFYSPTVNISFCDKYLESFGVSVKLKKKKSYIYGLFGIWNEFFLTLLPKSNSTTLRYCHYFFKDALVSHNNEPLNYLQKAAYFTIVN